MKLPTILLLAVSIAFSAVPSHGISSPTPLTVTPSKAGVPSASATMPLPSQSGEKSLSEKSAVGTILRGGTKISTYSAILAGMVLCFNSGYINGCCLKGTIAKTGQAGAAVTGAWTISSLSAAGGNGQVFRKQISVLFSYIFGSFLAGLSNPNPIPFTVSPSVGPTFLLASALLFTAIFKMKESWMLFCLCAMACGIQNSVTSVHTSNLVRSAHMSGLSSDMGTFLGQVLGGNQTNLVKLKTFAILGISFWTGGFFSWFVTEQYPNSNSLLPSAVFMGAAGLTLTTM